MKIYEFIDVIPSAAMTDVIVKIMVEVITILGIVTKEVGQISMSLFDFFYISQVSTFAQRIMRISRGDFLGGRMKMRFSDLTFGRKS